MTCAVTTVGDVDGEEDPPPHPESALMQKMLTPNMSSSLPATADLFRLQRNSDNKPIELKPENHKLVHSPTPNFAGAAPEIVKEVVPTPLADSAMVAGVKLHAMPVGRPEQAKETCPERPASDVICNATGCEVLPYDALSVLPESERLRSGAAPYTLSMFTADDDVAYGSTRPYFACKAWAPTAGVSVVEAVPVLSSATAAIVVPLSWK
jgi:hypothetical protein